MVASRPCNLPSPCLRRLPAHLQGEWDKSEPAKRIPNPLLPGLVRFFKGVICAVLWVKLSGPFGAGGWVGAGDGVLPSCMGASCGALRRGMLCCA